MGNKKNEQGYALLIVLFLVVFIMIVMAVFMRGSISNAKQEQKVDQNHLSVVAAEMGVDYYYNLFMNKYIEVRDVIWKENYTRYKKEENRIKSDKNLSDQERKDKIVALSIEYRNRFADKIKDELVVVGTVTPQGTYYDKSSGGFSITIQDEDANKYIAIRSKIAGEYPGGKLSTLEKELKLPIPIIGNVNGDNSSEGGSGIFDIPIIQWDVFNEIPKVGMIDELQITENVGDASDKNMSGLTNVLIQQIGNLKKGQMQDNKGYLNISATGNFTSSGQNIYGNENVSILTNGEFEAGQISGSIEQLGVSAIGDFSSGNIDRNKNVSIITNGNFNATQMDGNSGYLNLSVQNNFISGNISRNTKVSILTNGDFKSNLIDNTTGHLGIKVSGSFESGNLQYNKEVEYGTIKTNGSFKSGNVYGNKNMTIQTNGTFSTGLIQENEGDLTINATNDFHSGNLYGNTNGDILIQTNGIFTADLIQGNGGAIDIRATKDFSSGNLYGNTNGVVSIQTNGVFTAKQIQSNGGTLNLNSAKDFSSTNVYGNKNVTIQTYGSLKTGQIRDNSGQVKIITVGDFVASEVILSNNSFICVGGKFTVLSNSSLDETSYLYLMEGHGPVKNIQNQNQVNYVSKNEWESKCGTTVGGGVDSDSEVHWENPSLSVEY